MTTEPPLSRRGFLTGAFLASRQAQSTSPSTSPSRPVPANPQVTGMDQTPPPGTATGDNTPQMTLPDLNQAVLDHTTLNQLFTDIETCTNILEIIPKRGPGYTGTERVTLEQSRTLLEDSSVRGIQIRYIYDNAEWWDTLIRVDGGVKLVRIRHDFGTP